MGRWCHSWESGVLMNPKTKMKGGGVGCFSLFHPGTLFQKSAFAGKENSVLLDGRPKRARLPRFYTQIVSMWTGPKLASKALKKQWTKQRSVWRTIWSKRLMFSKGLIGDIPQRWADTQINQPHHLSFRKYFQWRIKWWGPRWFLLFSFSGFVLDLFLNKLIRHCRVELE